MAQFKDRLKRFPYGEAALWLLFLITVIAFSDNESVEKAMLAGVCALAAIGVRATRVFPSNRDVD